MGQTNIAKLNCIANLIGGSQTFHIDTKINK
jgi:hypothetical protein